MSVNSLFHYPEDYSKEKTCLYDLIIFQVSCERRGRVFDSDDLAAVVTSHTSNYFQLKALIIWWFHVSIDTLHLYSHHLLHKPRSQNEKNTHIFLSKRKGILSHLSVKKILRESLSFLEKARIIQSHSFSLTLSPAAPLPNSGLAGRVSHLEHPEARHQRPGPQHSSHYF